MAIGGNSLDDGPLLVEFWVYKLADDSGEHVDIALHDGQQFLGHLTLGLDLQAGEVAELGLNAFYGLLGAGRRRQVEVLLQLCLFLVVINRAMGLRVVELLEMLRDLLLFLLSKPQSHAYVDFRLFLLLNRLRIRLL